MATRDPFYSVKEKVQQSLTELRGLVQRADEVARGGGESAEVEPMLGAARTEVNNINVDVRDLAQTITIVEENRPRFPTIDNRELDSRRAFVSDAKTSLAHFGDDIKRISQKAALNSNKRKELLASRSTGADGRFASAANAEADRAGDDFVNSSRQSAMLIERQQDEVMDDMVTALERLQGISEDINKELVEGGVQLDALNDELDQAKSTMDVVLKKMDKLLKTSDKGRLCCIVVLFILAVALFFGIIYG